MSDLLLQRPLQVQYLLSTPCCVRRLFGNRLQEERQPFLPLTALANCKQSGVVLITMSFEVGAEIQKRLRQKIPVAQKQRHQQSADATIAVDEGVHRFELVMNQPEPDQRRIGIPLSHVVLHLRERLVHLVWRRRHVGSLVQGA